VHKDGIERIESKSKKKKRTKMEIIEGHKLEQFITWERRTLEI
jgi:hypothetical protein